MVVCLSKEIIAYFCFLCRYSEFMNDSENILTEHMINLMNQSLSV